MAGVALPLSSARAVTYAPTTLEQTIKSAPIIVRGVITGSFHSITDKPYTNYTLKITEVMKGAVGAGQIAIKQLGGFNLVMSGRVSFKIGENVIVMLQGPQADNTYRLYGMGMGKLTLTPSGELVGAAVEADKLAQPTTPSSTPSNSTQPQALGLIGVPPPPAAITPPKRTLTDLYKIIHDQSQGK
jgi:hypothetical protein